MRQLGYPPKLYRVQDAISGNNYIDINLHCSLKKQNFGLGNFLPMEPSPASSSSQRTMVSSDLWKNKKKDAGMHC